MAYIDLDSYITDGIVAETSNYANYYFQQEGIAYSRFRLIPGHFYSFNVVNALPNDVVPNLSETMSQNDLKQYSIKRPYYDNAPVCLSLGGQDGEIILNLKMIPPKLRSVIIRRYLGAVRERLKLFYDDSDNLMPFESRLADRLIGPFLTVNPAFMSKLTGINLSFALNKYQRENMANIALIDWEDVSKIEQIDYRNDPTISVKTPVAVLLSEFGK
jgi:hypothetical protein